MRSIFLMLSAICLYYQNSFGNNEVELQRLNSSIQHAIDFIEVNQSGLEVPVFSIFKLFNKNYNAGIELDDSGFIAGLNDDEYKEWYFYKPFFDTSFVLQEDCLEEKITQNILLRSFYKDKIRLPDDYLQYVSKLSKEGIYDLLHMYWVLQNVRDYYSTSSEKKSYNLLDDDLYRQINNAFFVNPTYGLTDEKVEAAVFVLLGKNKKTIQASFVNKVVNSQEANGSWCFLENQCNQDLTYIKEYKMHNTIVSLFLLLQYRANMILN